MRGALPLVCLLVVCVLLGGNACGGLGGSSAAVDFDLYALSQGWPGLCPRHTHVGTDTDTDTDTDTLTHTDTNTDTWIQPQTLTHTKTHKTHRQTASRVIMHTNVHNTTYRDGLSGAAMCGECDDADCLPAAWSVAGLPQWQLSTVLSWTCLPDGGDRGPHSPDAGAVAQPVQFPSLVLGS